MDTNKHESGMETVKVRVGLITPSGRVPRRSRLYRFLPFFTAFRFSRWSSPSRTGWGICWLLLPVPSRHAYRSLSGRSGSRQIESIPFPIVRRVIPTSLLFLHAFPKAFCILSKNDSRRKVKFLRCVNRRMIAQVVAKGRAEHPCVGRR